MAKIQDPRTLFQEEPTDKSLKPAVGGEEHFEGENKSLNDEGDKHLGNVHQGSQIAFAKDLPKGEYTVVVNGNKSETYFFDVTQRRIE